MKDPDSSDARGTHVARRRRKQFAQSDTDSQGEFFSPPAVVMASRVIAREAATPVPEIDAAPDPELTIDQAAALRNI
jgi:hypothetical protein